ncbi:MAG: integrase [Nitrospirales bacterium]
MNTIMTLHALTTLPQLEDFLAGTQPVTFSVLSTKDDCYQWIQTSLVTFEYLTLSKPHKGLVIRYLVKISGYSRQQLTRLIQQYRQTGRVTRRQRTVQGFARRYTDEDIRLLAAMDARHDTPSGPAIKKLCERACQLFGEAEYQRLATISIGHLSNLRQSQGYRRQRRSVEKTRPTRSTIGERRKPHPAGQPGFLRIDTVHQGDWDKQKGVYHINAVDEVTQFQVVCTVEKISEAYLIPALEQLLAAFPFTIQGFHSDNGSEYINGRVAALLGKLLIAFTKSRARQTNENALVESKNGAVVRKLFGHAHIPQRWASLINVFNQEHLTPYLNFHRPCFFPEIRTDPKGKERKVYHYETMMTPDEKLKALPKAKDHLKPGITFEILEATAHRLSDNHVADLLQKARQHVFTTIHDRTQNTG